MPVTFDGSTSLSRTSPLNGISSSTKGTCSFWIKRSGSPIAEYIFDSYNPLSNAGFRYSLRIRFALGDNSIIVEGSRGTATDLSYESDILISDTDWHHVVFSFDNTNSLFYMYIDRVLDTATVSQNTSTLPFADATAWYLATDKAGSNIFTGDLDDFLFWPGTYIDLTDADNLRRLISSDGITNYANPGPTAGTPKPVGYGPGGVTPTDGTEAIIVFTGPFLVNRGTGGAFETRGSFSIARAPGAYRQSANWVTAGTRWFDSDRSGFAYPRTSMFRDKEGRKIGWDEQDDFDRDDFREIDMGPLVFGSEEDNEEVI